MAFVTGSANSLADLLSAIQTACTANGWTLSGNVLSRGTCYVSVKINGTTLEVLGGRGVSAGALTGASNREPGQFVAPSTADTGIPASPTVVYPIQYWVNIHTNPDEVYVTINYAVNYFETMAWGQSAMPGLVGTGNWYCGANKGSGAAIDVLGERGYPAYGCYSLFCRYYYSPYPYAIRCGVDHSLDAVSWTTNGAGYDWYLQALRQPNAFNAASVLRPIRVYALRPSNFLSPVLECAHARFCNVANLSPGQIITLGPDKWMVFPWWTKTAGYVAQNYGHAIRYDGP